MSISYRLEYLKILCQDKVLSQNLKRQRQGKKKTNVACSSTALAEYLLIVYLSVLPMTRLAFGLLAVQNLALRDRDPALVDREVVLE